jgi:mono/diheme cytochrome c family protein
MRRLSVILLAGVLSAPAAQAQSVREGEMLARSVCSPCHVVASGFGGGEGPAFAAVAAMPSTTGLALTAFLQTSHGRMPNISLSRDDIANLASYILSLKPK